MKINTNSMYLDASPSFQITRQCQNLEDCVGLFCDLACLPDVLLCLGCMSASYSYPREYCSNLNCAIAKKTCGVGKYNSYPENKSVGSSVCSSLGLTRPLKRGGVSAQE